MRKAPVLQIEEMDGDKYPDRDTAQRAALPLISSNLQSLIRDLLERGVLVNDGNKIIPANKDKST